MSSRLTLIPIAIAVIAVSSLAFWTRAKAHEAPQGWSYDRGCCDTTDCREVPASWVRETTEGYTITKTGETLAYGDTRIKDSKDEYFHWCSMGGKDDGRTLCLYVPPRGY